MLRSPGIMLSATRGTDRSQRAGRGEMTFRQRIDAIDEHTEHTSAFVELTGGTRDPFQLG